jgi:YD repeat-containing protein
MVRAFIKYGVCKKTRSSLLSAGPTTYSYLPITGELQTITDPNGTPYTYSWNVVGLPSGVSFPVKRTVQK